MGLDTNGVKFLLHAKARAVDFTHAAMIGRQRLHLNAHSLRKTFHAFGYMLRHAEATRMLKESNGYAEVLLTTLGAAEIFSFDAAHYENASHTHDFNCPIDGS
jgi:hypothetical protein